MNYELEIKARIAHLKEIRVNRRAAYKNAYSYSRQMELLTTLNALTFAIEELERLLK